MPTSSYPESTCFLGSTRHPLHQLCQHDASFGFVGPDKATQSSGSPTLSHETPSDLVAALPHSALNHRTRHHESFFGLVSPGCQDGLVPSFRRHDHLLGGLEFHFSDIERSDSTMADSWVKQFDQGLFQLVILFDTLFMFQGYISKLFDILLHLAVLSCASIKDL